MAEISLYDAVNRIKQECEKHTACSQCSLRSPRDKHECYLGRTPSEYNMVDPDMPPSMFSTNDDEDDD